MTEYEILTTPNVKMPDNPAYTFPFECDPFQLHSFNSIEQGKHILVSAPTSSGKTCCAEYAIYHYLRNNKRIIYTSPIKSLSNEKYKEFKEKNICKVGLLTGDNKINPDADLIIATAEILRNGLYSNGEQSSEYNILNNVGCVIMDEVHFINDLDRGKVWEETLILLSQDIQLVLLSATIDRVNEFAKWIQSIKTKQVSLICTDRRIIPLSHFIFVGEELYEILDNRDTFYEETYYSTKKKYEKLKSDPKNFESDTQQINSLIKYLMKKDLFQTIFFSFSRIKCEEFAKSVNPYLISTEEQSEALNIFDYNIAPYKKIYETLPQFITIRKLIQKGVAFHHSGLIPILKEIIEIIFKKGLIKILFATETFAVGVNMPTRTVVFTNLSKNTNQGKRFLDTAEYKQMSGRAGRRGMDTMGTVIIMTMHEFPELLDLKSVMIKSMPHISSKFKIDYDYCLKTLNTINTSPEALFLSSLLSNEINKELINHKNKLEEINESYKHLLEEFNLSCSDEIKSNCEKIYSREKLTHIGNIVITLTPKQKKENLKLKKSIPEEIYNKFERLKEIETDYKILSNTIKSKESYINISTEKIFKIISEKGFVSSDNNVETAKLTVKLTVKGVIAALINDCNGILLAEIIANGTLNKLNTVEIISLLSIFTNPPKNNDEEKYISKHLNMEYNQIISIIESYNKLEKDNKYIVADNYWSVTNMYIDLTYDWVTQNDPNELRGLTLSHLQAIGEYEGNFVRNMLKIYNIICNIRTLCDILKYNELQQKLETVDSMILKDIVNVNSLYLN
jgi:superfamily II RNA helicase